MDVFEELPLSQILHYKIGGPAKYVLRITTKSEVEKALDFVKKHKVKKILPVGLGSNILPSDSYFNGAVLWFTQTGKPEIEVDSDGLIHAFAGTLFDDLIQFSFRSNLLGLAWAGGLPSTVGGAIRGNAGAFGSQTGDSIHSVEVLDMTQGQFERKILTQMEAQFSYRNSIVKQNPNLLVISGIFSLPKGSKKEMSDAKKIYRGNIAHREKKNPLEYPSCGSTFKSIIAKEDVKKITDVWPDVKEMILGRWHGKVAMGYVIERLGFVDYTVGDALVSKKHANYILNVGNAKAKDVLTIINLIKERFFQTFGFYPELEVESVDN